MTPHPDQIDLSDYAQTGSREALGRLVQRHIDFVYGVARRETGDAHVAEDVVQAVFLVLSKRAAHVRSASLSGWLFSTTCHIAANARRSIGRRRRHEQQAAQNKGEQIMNPDTSDIEHLQHHLHAALAGVGEADRSIVLMRFMEGLEVTQIGQVMGLTEAAARKRLERAMHKLRKLLTGRGIVLESAVVGAALTGLPQSAPAGLTAAVMGGTASAGGVALAGGTGFSLHLKVAAMLLVMMGIMGIIGSGFWARLFQTGSMAMVLQADSAPATMPAEVSIPITYTGTVRAPDGRLVAGARVWSELASPNPVRAKPVEAETRTDAEGRYTLAPVPALDIERYAGPSWRERTLRFDHPDYAIAWYNARAENELMDGYVVTRNVQLESPKDIRVQVLDQDSKPVVGAEVSLFLQHFGAWDRRSGGGERAYGYLSTTGPKVLTGADGMATFQRIPELARSHVAISHPDYARQATRDHVRSDTFPVRPGRGPLVVRLAQGGQIRLFAPRGEGRPRLEYAELRPVARVQNSQRNFFTHATFGADGTYLLTGLLPGTYDLQIQTDSESGDGLWMPLTGVEVVAGRTVEAELRWAPARRISGRLVDSRTRVPLKGEYVTIASAGDPATTVNLTRVTDRAGRYSVTLLDGRYRISAYSYDGQTQVPAEKVIDVGEAHPQQVGDIEMMPRPSIRGQLVDTSNRPVAGVAMTLSDPRRSAVDGVFEVPIRTGGPMRERTYGYAVSMDRTLAAAFEVDGRFTDPKLAEPGAEFPKVVLRAAATMTGQIVDKEGNPVTGAQVSLNVPLGQGMSLGMPRPPWAGFSTEGNRFTYNVVPIGLPEMYISINGNGGYAQVPLKDLNPGEIRDFGTITLTPRTSGRGVVLPPQRDFTGRLRGRVLDADGQPMAGASLQASPEATYGPMMDDTDHEGSFEIRGLPRGEQVRLSVSAQGYEPHRQEVAVDVPDLEIRLSFNASALIGKPAPELSVADWVQAGPVWLADQKGKVVLLHIGTDVGDYRSLGHHVITAHEKFAARGLVVVVINRHVGSNDGGWTPRQRIPELVEKQKLPFAVAIDGPGGIGPGDRWISGSTASAYGMTDSAMILIDRKGNVRASADYANLGEWIERLLAE